MTQARRQRCREGAVVRWLMTLVLSLAAAGFLAGCGPSVAGVGPGAEDERLKQLALKQERALGAHDCGTEWDLSTRDWQQKHSPRDHWVAECQFPPFEPPPTPIDPTGTTYRVTRFSRPSGGHAQVVVETQVPGAKSYELVVFLVKEKDGRWAVEDRQQ